MLVVSANPSDRGGLALDEEVRDITAGLRATPGRDLVELRTAWAARPGDLLTELNEHRPAVVHFSGHGDPDGRLRLLDPDGASKLVTGQALAAILATVADTVQLVVLNACHSAQVAQTLTQQHITLAIGMNGPIRDVTARVFAARLYAGLGYGLPVGRAFAQARAALMFEGIPEEHIPQLYARDGVDPDEAVLVSKAVLGRRDGTSRDDTATLRARSAEHLAHVARHGALPIGEGVAIERALATPLRQRAAAGHLLLVGPPGVGKTGALHRLAVDLQAAGDDVVVVAADLLSEAESQGLRHALGVARDPVDVLAAWTGEKTAFLLVDALDTARGPEASAALVNLIRRMTGREGRWRVVASVRSFDLRHNPVLQDAFPHVGASSADLVDPEFTAVRHLAVGSLSDAELGRLAGLAPRLHAFLCAAPPALRELARVPFNLRLLAGLLGPDDVDPGALSGVGTQLELLDLYWERRVLAPASGRDARERLAAQVCRRAVARMRLQVPRADVRQLAATGHALDELLRAGVLIESRTARPGGVERLGFAHHVLFDYAVHRLLLSGEPDEIARQLGDHDELALLARPSLMLTLQAAWEADPARTAFWSLALRLADPRLPALARMAAPTVAADLVRSVEDLRPLFAALDRQQPHADHLLRHLVAARVTPIAGGRPLTAGQLWVWGQAACALAERLSAETAYPVRLLVLKLGEQRAQLSADAVAAFGEAARALLSWAWAQEPPRDIEVTVGLGAVAHSYGSDPDASAALLRRVLDPARLPGYGFRELRQLVQEIPTLLVCDCELVAELYEAGFGFKETSDAVTALGNSRLLPLTSTRRQDWDLNRYLLAELFPAVLRAAPAAAIRALAAGCGSKRTYDGEPQEPETPEFEVSGRRGAVIADGSGIWDHAEGHGEAITMLDAFQNHLVALSEAGDAASVEHLLDALSGPARPAALWRRVMRAGANAPQSLAPQLVGLLASPQVLCGFDTTEPAGELLRAGYRRLGSGARERIEQAIMGVPHRYSPDRLQVGERIRDRLLGCPPAELLVTAEARARRSELDTAGGPPANEPVFRMTVEDGSGADASEDWRHLGIDLRTEPNQRLLALVRPVRDFAGAHGEHAVDLEQVEAVMPALESLRKAVSRPDHRVDRPLLDEARAWLSEAASVVAAQTPLPVGHRCLDLARQLALEGTAGVRPEPHPSDDDFDGHDLVSWSTPSGRIDAARALLLLAREPSLVDAELLDAVEALAHDPVPAVRWETARLVSLAASADAERVWRLIENIAAQEPSANVGRALLRSISRLMRDDVDRAVAVARRMYDREQAGRAREPLLRDLGEFLLDAWVWRRQPAGRELLDGWLAALPAYATIAPEVFSRLRDTVTHGDDTAEAQAIRHRALGVWADLTRAAADHFAAHTHDPAEERDQEALHAVAGLLHMSGIELHFASGAYTEENNAERRLSPKIRRRFYREADPLIEILLDVGLPSVVHRMLETLATFVEHDPRGVLLRLGRLLDAGRAWGYEAEGIAEHAFTRLVERYLAAHRGLLLTDRACRGVLVQALEGFIEAGHPGARQLLDDLDDMFR